MWMSKKIGNHSVRVTTNSKLKLDRKYSILKLYQGTVQTIGTL